MGDGLISCLESAGRQADRQTDVGNYIKVEALQALAAACKLLLKGSSFVHVRPVVVGPLRWVSSLLYLHDRRDM